MKKQIIKRAKILVAAPISNIKEYCREEWIEHILNLTYENYDILLVDNSADDKYHRMLQKLYPTINFLYYNPKGLDSRVFITECQEKIRRYAVHYNYSHIMMIECDVKPPLNCIEELLRMKTDVACGFYQWGFKDDRKPLIQVSEEFDTHFSTRNMDFDEAFLLADGKCHEVFSPGLGCALISRRVFSNIVFRYIKGEDMHSDPNFFMDCELMCYRVIVNTKVFCEHLNQPWAFQDAANMFAGLIK